MKTAREFLLTELHLEMPKETVPLQWFLENELPTVVECTCCGMTMALPAAFIDDEGYTFCSSCAESEG